MLGFFDSWDLEFYPWHLTFAIFERVWKYVFVPYIHAAYWTEQHREKYFLWLTFNVSARQIHVQFLTVAM